MGLGLGEGVGLGEGDGCWICQGIFVWVGSGGGLARGGIFRPGHKTQTAGTGTGNDTQGVVLVGG